MPSDDINIDLTGYKDRVGERVAPGRYRVIVDDAEPDTAKSGNAMINLWLRVQGGEYDGATIVDRLVLTPNSLFRVVGFMQAIGLPTPHKKLRVNMRQFINKALDVDVEDGDPYNGRVKSEIRGYLRIPKGAQESADMPDLPVADDLPTTAADDLDGLSEFLPAPDTESVVPDEVDLENLDLG